MSNLDFNVIRHNGPLPDPCLIDTEQIVGELWTTYIDTVESHLSALEAAAMSLESTNDVEADAAGIRRILHSIKGDSGMCGVIDAYNLCHEAEYAFEELEDSATKADMLLKVKDWIAGAIEYIENGSQATSEGAAPVSTEEKKLKALIIDDNRVCRERVKMLIGKYCNFLVARDGRQGFELFKEAFEEGNPFDLITLDIEMPEMNGHETLSVIRDFERSRGVHGLDGVKIIMTTSMDEGKHIFSAFRKGCEAYVVKKTMGEKLLEEMSRLGLLRSSTSYSVE